MFYFFFFFNDTATTEIYTLSLHDALPISITPITKLPFGGKDQEHEQEAKAARDENRDRKSTRLNSSHLGISYAVFCLKKKKKQKKNYTKKNKITKINKKYTNYQSITDI